MFHEIPEKLSSPHPPSRLLFPRELAAATVLRPGKREGSKLSSSKTTRLSALKPQKFSGQFWVSVGYPEHQHSSPHGAIFPPLWVCLPSFPFLLEAKEESKGTLKRRGGRTWVPSLARPAGTRFWALVPSLQHLGLEREAWPPGLGPVCLWTHLLSLIHMEVSRRRAQAVPGARPKRVACVTPRPQLTCLPATLPSVLLSQLETRGVKPNGRPALLVLPGTATQAVLSAFRSIQQGQELPSRDCTPTRWLVTTESRGSHSPILSLLPWPSHAGRNAAQLMNPVTPSIHARGRAHLPHMCSNRGIQCGMFQKTDTCSVEGNRPRSLSIYSLLSSLQLTHSTSHTHKRRAWATEQEAKSMFTRPGKGSGRA